MDNLVPSNRQAGIAASREESSGIDKGIFAPGANIRALINPLLGLSIRHNHSTGQIAQVRQRSLVMMGLQNRR